LVEASQRPCVYLDPTTSEGGELVLPFFHPFETIDISENTDLLRMGEIDVFEMNDLRHANGNTDGVSVTAFAWATDVQLSGSTFATTPSLTPQSGKANDEYGRGIVSKPASIVAAVAGRLSTIPILSPYARATEFAAQAVRGIAEVFGYSRPINIDPIHRFRPEYVQNLANADGQDNSTKLTLDSKQETTIDTRVMGLSGEDELNIKTIAMRQSYLYTVPWTSLEVEGTPIFTCPVTPNLFRVFASEQTEYHLTAMAFAGAMFQFWRGTIRFRFQVVASAYHRGRIRITYDPTISTSDPPFNVGYSYVLDIGEDRDFTVDVGWTQQQGMLRFGPIVGIQEPPRVDPADFPNVPDFYNGSIRVEVLNPLTTPSGTATDVSINVFVCTGDDFEVASPTSSTINVLTPLEPQSGILDPQSGMVQDSVDMAQHEDENAAQQQDSVAQFAELPGVSTQALLTYSGEVITSLRTVLKRYVIHRTEPITTQLLLIVQPTYPRFAGADPLGQETQLGQPWSTANVTPLNWVLPAYVGYRGAIRVGAHITSNENRPSVWMALTRITGDISIDPQFIYTTVASFTSTQLKYYFKLITNASLNGTSVTMIPQRSIYVEIPYQLNKKFLFGKRIDQLGSNDRGEYTCYSFVTSTISAFALTNTATFAYSVGEDFQVGFYTGPPVLFEIQEVVPP
jgi:hypothetical protein